MARHFIQALMWDHDCLLNRLFRRRSKKTSKLRVTDLCAGNSPVTDEFPAPMASNAENVCIWWLHHGGWCNRWNLDGRFQEAMECLAMFHWCGRFVHAPMCLYATYRLLIKGCVGINAAWLHRHSVSNTCCKDSIKPTHTGVTPTFLRDARHRIKW